jgi:hypothetical protein
MYKNTIKYFCITTLLVMLFAADSYAQMFSVRSSEIQRGPTIPGNNLLFSYDITDFSFFGKMDPQAPFVRYDFNGPLYRVQYETPLFHIFAGFGGSLGAEKNIRVTTIGVGLSGMYPISQSQKFQVTIPLTLNTDYTLIRTGDTANTSDEFAQNSGYIGAGLNLHYLSGAKFRIRSSSQPQIGYTTGSLGSTGGVSWKISQQIRVYFDQLIGPAGISIGYDFRLVRFKNSEEMFNYDMMTNGFLIGITF